MTANELVVILKEHQLLKAHMANLIEFQQDLQDRVAAQGEQGEVKELVAGGDRRDGGDRDDKDDEDDELDCPEFVQGSLHQ